MEAATARGVDRTRQSTAGPIHRLSSRRYRVRALHLPDVKTTPDGKVDLGRSQSGWAAETEGELMRRRLRRGWTGGTLGSVALVALLMGALILGRTEALAAQPWPPKVPCNSATDWQLFWPRVPGAGPLPVVVTFDAVAGQVVDFQLNVRGPLAFNDYVGAFLYSPSGANLFPDLEDRYQLR